MKRTSAITQLLTVLLLAGCSQNEVTDVNPDSHPAVGFGVYTGLATRGVDMTTESMKDSPSDAEKYGGFGIMGYFTGQETFENVKTQSLQDICTIRRWSMTRKPAHGHIAP